MAFDFTGGADFACTKDGIAASWPCSACLNVDEIEAVIIYLLQEALGDDHDVDQALEDAACLTCLDDRQMLEGIMKTLINSYTRNATIAEATPLVACWKCATPRQRKAVILRLFCRFIASIQQQN